MVTILKLSPQWHHAAVDLSSDTPVADLGVDSIGEINGRGAMREVDQIASWGKAEYLVGEHFKLGMLKEFLRPGRMFENV